MRSTLLRSCHVPRSTSVGGSATYRRSFTEARLLSQPRRDGPVPLQTPSLLALSTLLRPATSSQVSPVRIPLPARRTFLSSSSLWQQQQQKTEGSESTEAGKQSSNESSEQKSKQEEQQGEGKSEGGKREEGKSEEGKSEEGADKNKDAPPPPPHGDKTPWQVFTETLSSEFKASKEWNESTKALASSANEFTESESVRKARAAYQSASEAASTRTSSALRHTGSALGKGAAWTWDTPVVKGVRAGVSVTGKGIDKATQPIRETKAYKAAVGEVKDVIDDGSSSRYGGWIEKEERRKQRELRELNEAKAGRLNNVEKMEEDPE